MEMRNLDSHTATIAHEFDFIAGNLCLDFANTLGGLPADSPTQERLTSYPRLVAWSQQADLMSENESHALLHQAANAPPEAVAILERALALRAGIYGVFEALALGTPLPEGDLDLLNRELGWAMAGARVVVTPAGFDWDWPKEEGAFDQMLGPIVRSAGMLLTAAERQLVRQCANPPCNWLFVDTTKNHSRRWCRTEGCGNMNRVRQHRARQRNQEKSPNDG